MAFGADWGTIMRYYRQTGGKRREAGNRARRPGELTSKNVGLGFDSGEILCYSENVMRKGHYLLGKIKSPD